MGWSSCSHRRWIQRGEPCEHRVQVCTMKPAKQSEGRGPRERPRQSKRVQKSRGRLPKVALKGRHGIREDLASMLQCGEASLVAGTKALSQAHFGSSLYSVGKEERQGENGYQVMAFRPFPKRLRDLSQGSSSVRIFSFPSFPDATDAKQRPSKQFLST